MRLIVGNDLAARLDVFDEALRQTAFFAQCFFSHLCLDTRGAYRISQTTHLLYPPDNDGFMPPQALR